MSDLPRDLSGLGVLVYSLGIEGRDLATFFLARGARVTVSDTRTEEQLRAAGASVPPGVEAAHIGRPLLDPQGFDLLAVSQSVLRHNPAVVRARELGIPVTSQMRLFLQLCQAPVIGITGSSGKSTTTALVGAMARRADVASVVGGNIGEALLARVGEITPDTTVILEISHTQLQYTDRSPRIAAVTNVTPNHLDQFNWDEYVGLKRNILAYQGRGDFAVMNADDPTSRALMAGVRGHLLRTSLRGDPGGDAAWLGEDGVVRTRVGVSTRELLPCGDVRLRGEHNLANVVMAAAIATVAGFPSDAIAAVARSFRGVPHRLEPVAHVDGVLWVNDSIATSPERTVAGLRAYTEPVVLLLGGREKNLPLDRLCDEAKGRCRAVVCFGEARELFAGALRVCVPNTVVVPDLAAAVEAAAAAAHPGDVVLLSPAGTSFDAYPNFEARGAAFRELVLALPNAEPEVGP